MIKYIQSSANNGEIFANIQKIGLIVILQAATCQKAN